MNHVTPAMDFTANDRIPWHIFLFIFAVFYLSTPFDITFSRGLREILDYGDPNLYDLTPLMTSIREGHIARRIALIALGGVGLITLARCWRRVTPTGILLLLLFFLFGFWATLSIAWSVAPALTVRRLSVIWLIAGGALCFGVRLSVRDFPRLTFFVCGATLLLSVIAELALSTFHPFQEGYRFAGVLHPVPQGWNCGLLVISAFDLFRNEKRGRFVYLVIFFLAFIFLLFTGSRMPMAGTLVALWVYCLLTMSFGTILAYLGSALFIAWIGYFVAGDFFIQHSDYFINLGRGEAGMEGMRTLTGRTDLWRECLRYAVDRPLIGYGYETFLTPRFFLQISKAIDWVPLSAHSGYIQVFLGLGLVGVSLLLAVLFTVLKRSFLFAQRSKDYVFFITVLLWYSWNLMLESLILTDPVFPAFLAIMIALRMAFVQEAEPITEMNVPE
jgi:exopolysaccharide production protein ExoQ